jgi:F0F1-type ATP synthase assembly protein I
MAQLTTLKDLVAFLTLVPWGSLTATLLGFSFGYQMEGFSLLSDLRFGMLHGRQIGILS